MYRRVPDSEQTLMFYLAEVVHEVICLHMQLKCVVGLLLTLEVDLLKPAKSFTKLFNRLFICKVKSDCDCSSFAAYQDKAERKPRATVSSKFPLGWLFKSSFLSGTGLIVWKPYAVSHMCLKACAGWEGSLPRMRRKMLCRTHSRLQMMGFPVGVV